MKYIKMLGLATVAAVAVMAFVGAGSASATELTCNGVKCPIGTVFHASTPAGTHTVLHPVIGAIECNSTIEGTVQDAGSPTTTAKLSLGTLALTPCTNGAVVTTLKKGTLELHSTAGGGNATVTLFNWEVTIQAFGFHCIFLTGPAGIDIGTMTTNTSTPGAATFDLGATIPRTGGTSGVFCGSTAKWTGTYRTTKPTTLVVH